MKDEIASIIAGGLAGFNGYWGIDKLLEYVNSKSIIVQELLSKEGPLTKEMYSLAEKTAQEMVDSGDLFIGLASLTVSGACAGVSVYYANRGNKPERNYPFKPI